LKEDDMNGNPRNNMNNEELYRSVGGVPLFQGDGGVAWYFGWIPRQANVDAYLRRRELRLFSDVGKRLAETGAGKTVLLYEAVRQVWGRDLDIGPQQIGDCVSWGYAGCVDLIACLEVVAGEAEEHSWELRTCTEAVYALSRVEFGDFDGSFQDGSYGAWASVAVCQGGTLSRQRLGSYDPQRAKQWGAAGLPDELELEAREHRIRRTALIRTFAEARDAIANGYPVAVCSAQGFDMVRDDEGFAQPSGTWYHCMKFIAARDDHRPGLLCMNSWGDRHSGPKGDYDIPDGSFWVDASVCTHMFQSWLDSYALSQFDGYPRRLEAFSSLVP
jgi:hypothetical protein